ncbi:MAG: YciI family protein [Cyanobacteria bacterium]|nr:YciI family protein [Cyanobacteriota bacterium]
MAKFVLWGTYSPDVLERRVPFREEHLSGLRQQKEQGVLLTLGPTGCTTRVFGLYEAESQEQVEGLVKGDVYWRQGIWTSVEVYPWIQAF